VRTAGEAMGVFGKAFIWNLPLAVGSLSGGDRPRLEVFRMAGPSGGPTYRAGL